MKRMILSIGLGLTLATGVFAADNTLDQLNEQVVSILAPFQDEVTVAQLTFNALETDADRAVKMAVDGHYRKIGSQNTLDVKVDNLSYVYGDGSAPTTSFKGSFGFDFTKLLSQEQINQMVDHASQLLDIITQEYLREYGDAASIKGTVTSTTTDDEGNYTGFSAMVAAKIDLKKLPEEKKIEDIIATEAMISVTVNLKTGVMIDAVVISNPEYIGFKEGQEGLKDTLDKLLARDEEELAKIGMLVKWLDSLATQLVEYN